ncbi:DinB family protein [Arcicella aurantiaca]|uniref:DinB family protein n=1 Tax=Arcicella aurantiaca TaxID=591202 RepID=A0A316EFW9_9BACT|nr:DinB family protein [Arcicella aurantiaca]PWK28593.1 DinB family protein [Arcicella aurantiaca]
MDKISLLNQLENQVENHLQQALVKFQNATNEISLKPSDSNGWSIAQCLEHLNTYSHYYLPLFEQEIAKSPDKPEANLIKSSWLGRKSIESMNPETGTKKFKALKNHIPVPDLDAQAVIAEFISHQERLLQIIRLAKSKDIQQIKIPISIAKFLKLNLGDALQFLIVHNERHIQQANRNL